MTYDEFTSQYTEALAKYISDAEFSIEKITSEKINQNKDGLIIKFENSPVCPIVYFGDEYQSYLNGNSLDEIAKKTVSELQNLRGTSIEVPELTTISAKENFYCVVANIEKNQELLKNVPHECFHDIAIVPRFKVGENASFIIRNDHCKLWQMTPTEVLEQAQKNMKEHKFECISISEMMRELLDTDDMPNEMQENCPMYILTNEARIEGAVALISPTVMGDAYVQIKAEHPEMTDMYVLASSRHELILLPDDTVSSPEELKEVHLEVQHSNVDEVDRLSEHIYKYDAESKKLSIVDVPEIIKNESRETIKSRCH